MKRCCMKKYKLILTSSPIVAHPRKLRAIWTLPGRKNSVNDEKYYYQFIVRNKITRVYVVNKSGKNPKKSHIIKVKKWLCDKFNSNEDFILNEGSNFYDIISKEDMKKVYEQI